MGKWLGKVRAHPAGMNPCPLAALDREWRWLGRTPAAASQLKTWAESHPALGGHADPCALVAAAHQMIEPSRQEMEAALSSLAGEDALAARTLLQLLLPRLRREATHRLGVDLSVSLNEVLADLVAKLWENIRTCCRADHPDPGRALIERTAAMVRRQRRVERRIEGRRKSLRPELVPSVGLWDATSSAERLAGILTEAHRRGTLPGHQGRLVMAVASGYPPKEAARRVGLDQPRAVYYQLQVARRRLRETCA